LLAALAPEIDVGRPLVDGQPRRGTTEPFRPTSAPPAFSPQLSSTYLLRLEQLLAVRTAAMNPPPPPLRGERDSLDGHLPRCLDQPESTSIRLMFAHPLRGMTKARPDIRPEFRARTDLLQKEKPRPEPAQSVVTRILAEAFAE